MKKNYFIATGLFLVMALAVSVFAYVQSDYFQSGSTVMNESGFYGENAILENLNNVLYVQAGNASDIQTQINLCSIDGCKLIIPPGTYNITSTINMSNDVWVEGQGESTIIKPNTDINVFDINSTRSKISDLMIDTSGVNDYSSAAILFDSNIRYSSSREHLSNLYIKGTQAQESGSKGIYFKDNNSEGITWVRVENIEIEGYNYGILMNCSSDDGYINGNQLIDIHFNVPEFGLFMIMDDAETCDVDGNYFRLYSNGNANINTTVVLDGDRNIFDTILFDQDQNANYAYNISIRSNKNIITDNILTGFTEFNIGNGDNDIRLQDTRITKNIYLDSPTNEDGRMRIRENNVDKWIFHRDNNLGSIGEEVLAIQNGSSDNQMMFTQEGQIWIGDGTAQKNITMTSPDGSEGCCGMNDDLSWVCSDGACS